MRKTLLLTYVSSSHGSPTGLGDHLLGIFESYAQGVSGDGSVVVGFGDAATGGTAFTWNTTTTTLAPLAPLLAGGESHAYGVSGDGLTAVGSSDSASGLQATSWLGTGAPVALGDLTGGAFRSQALAASDDGLTIVGDSDSSNGTEAFIWQVLMTGLGDLAGGIFSSTAFDVTDGGVVVGSSSGTTVTEAFIWDSQHGMLSLTDVLVANGLAAQVAGWTLTEARAISDDGLTIAGFGINPDGDTEGWITTISAIPEPSTALLLGMGLALLARRRRS
jgi:uncharacterized membrane protein